MESLKTKERKDKMLKEYLSIPALYLENMVLQIHLIIKDYSLNFLSQKIEK